MVVLLTLIAFINYGCMNWVVHRKATPTSKEARVARGPLRVLDSNPRYFTDGTGKAIYLTGSHHWNNLQDSGIEPIPIFDYSTYLDRLQKYNHNLVRLWVRESAAWASWTDEKVVYDPLPYRRRGPGTALDGGLKFDLTELSEDYFDRLRSRVVAAGDRGIYVAVMLFQGFSIESKGRRKGNPWRGHPYHSANNVNGMNGDVDGDGEGTEVHTLQVPAITAFQEAYVRKTIDTLNDLDNVLYEISNESHANSEDWQYHMITFIKSYEAGKPKQHPVGMTVEHPGGDNSELTNSPADWISPNNKPPKEDEDAGLVAKGADVQSYDYKSSPPLANGKKVILSDTDHLWGLGGNPDWVWKSFLRGLNPIFMDPDPNQSERHVDRVNLPNWESVRSAMGNTLTFAKRMDLAAMVPDTEIASSGYCLANDGEEYLVYLPADDEGSVGKTVSVDLSAGSAALAVEWFNPRTAETILAGTTRGGTINEFTAPFPGAAVLYIRAQE